MSDKLHLARFDENMIKEIYQLGFTEEEPEWAKWDAPYFQNYHKFDSYESFYESSIASFFMSERCRCIIYQQQPVGVVTYYWENERTQWLNVGIAIYQATSWDSGIGTKALTLWLDIIFQNFELLEHIGLVTWSGNDRMMRVAEKIGMKCEARIRKSRYWQEVYYDSMSYGILREEWCHTEK